MGVVLKNTFCFVVAAAVLLMLIQATTRKRFPTAVVGTAATAIALFGLGLDLHHQLTQCREEQIHFRLNEISTGDLLCRLH